MNKVLRLIAISFYVFSHGLPLHAVEYPTVDPGRVSDWTSHGEFSLSLPYDWNAVGKGWRYKARYVNHEWSANLHFGWVILDEEDNRYELALYKRDVMVDKRFDDIDIKDKRAASAIIKSIDRELADSIGIAWAAALRRARYFADPVTATDAYYISVFDYNSGYMCATAQRRVEHATSAMIIDIGKAVAAYAEATDPLIEANIRLDIAKKCADVSNQIER